MIMVGFQGAQRAHTETILHPHHIDTDGDKLHLWSQLRWARLRPPQLPICDTFTFIFLALLGI